MSGRVRAFVVIGTVGFVVQLAVLAWLNRAGVALPIATALAVEAAVLHNFIWHQHWTWRDRGRGEGTASAWWARLLRFHTSNGVVSLALNVVLTWMLARILHMPPLAANALAVAAGSLVNFVAADRWVFARSAPIALVVCVLTAAAAGAAPSSTTLDAWTRYVHEAEARGTTQQTDCDPAHEPIGDSIKVADGTIYRWSSCTVVKNVQVSTLVDALVASGTPPPQQDVLESRLLSRDGDHLRVYLQLVRHTIMTVSYHTEHDMTFRRHSPALVTSRSVATSIAQTDGGDHGFLWRLNSYWAYRQIGSDVRVELVSLSLSRDVPLLVRPMAAPLIASLARESMQRTLAAVRHFGETEARGAGAVSLRPVHAP